MPRYNYRCPSCEIEFLARHSSNETLEECEKCGYSGSLIKLVSKPSYMVKKKEDQRKVGQLTEKFIEESRQELKQQKKELNKNR